MNSLYNVVALNAHKKYKVSLFASKSLLKEFFLLQAYAKKRVRYCTLFAGYRMIDGYTEKQVGEG